MGMFDEIKYEYFLPLEVSQEVKDKNFVPEDVTFQTKDLDNSLSLYFINKEGKLIHKNVKYKWVDDDNSLLKGYMKEESHTLVDTKYHGDLRFYCYENIDKDDKQFCIALDYVARFTDGRVQSVKLEKSEVKDTTDRKEDLQRMFSEMERHKKLWYNKYFLNTKLYRKLIKNPIFSIVRCLNNITSKLNYFVTRHL